MKRAMISQPMAGRTEEEILAVRAQAIADLDERGCLAVNTFFDGAWYCDDNLKTLGVAQNPLYFLAKSLEAMATCHAVYFCKGWENARGCRIEHMAAKAYGLEIMYEEDGR